MRKGSSVLMLSDKMAVLPNIEEAEGPGAARLPIDFILSAAFNICYVQRNTPHRTMGRILYLLVYFSQKRLVLDDRYPAEVATEYNVIVIEPALTKTAFDQVPMPTARESQYRQL